MYICYSEPRPESANSRSAWGLGGDDNDVPAFNRQKSTGIDIQSGGPAITSHEALGINDSFLGKIGRGVRCVYLFPSLYNSSRLCDALSLSVCLCAVHVVSSVFVTNRHTYIISQ